MENSLTEKRYLKSLQDLYTKVKKNQQVIASHFAGERKISQAFISHLVKMRILEKLGQHQYKWIADRHPDMKMATDVIAFNNSVVRESAAKISVEERERRKEERKARKLAEKQKKLDEAKEASGETEKEQEEEAYNPAELKQQWIEEMRWRAKNNMLHQPKYMKTHKGDFIKLPMETAKVEKNDPELKVLEKIKQQQGKAKKVKIEITYYYE